jgi:F-type H+-transporting ATPase subunit epsilon
MPTINVDIVSAEGEIYSGDAPLLTALKPGEVRVQDTEGKEHFFYITGGMLEVQPHAVMVLADTALRGDQLDEAAALAAAALAARDEAAKALEGMSAETDLAKAQAELAEAEARYRAAQKLKGKR